MLQYQRLWLISINVVNYIINISQDNICIYIIYSTIIYIYIYINIVKHLNIYIYIQLLANHLNISGFKERQMSTIFDPCMMWCFAFASLGKHL